MEIMKSVTNVCWIGAILIWSAGAQDSSRTALREGVSVQMAVAGHAVEMRAADEPDATVVAITADGKVFAGVKPVEPDALSNVSAETLYVKADARAPYQTVLTVLDALRGKSVVLLAAPPANAAATQGVVSPYGIRLIVSR
jgi:hypothetical protein